MSKGIKAEFIQNLIDKSMGVSIYLVNGIQLKGTIERFDDECLILVGDHQTQLVHFQVVSTIVPRDSEKGENTTKR